jgi:uncharacterized protein (DUF779 family)
VTETAGQLVATDAALAALERLTAEYGELILFLSGGCCDGSSPICLRAGQLLLGPNDLHLGDVAGVPFYIDGDQYERWNEPAFELDAAAGAAEGFSLEGLHGIHFFTRTPTCSA